MAIVSISCALAACNAVGERVRDETRDGLFRAQWNSGQNPAEPPFQVQAIDPNTFAIRQSIRTSFEAPFMYLLMGDERALLIDTGDGANGLRAQVEALIGARQAASGAPIDLIVMHSHAHSDHTGADADFASRPNTVVVGHTPNDVAAFFGLREWPDGIADLDLGGRVLKVLPAPGHHASHVVVFDEVTGIMFTGDTVYPGLLRFQCGNVAAFERSIGCLADLARENEARWLLGAHIEMRDQPREFYQSTARERRDEHALELNPAVLDEIATALRHMAEYPRVQAFGDFVLFPYPANPQGLSPPDWCATTG